MKARNHTRGGDSAAPGSATHSAAGKGSRAHRDYAGITTAAVDSHSGRAADQGSDSVDGNVAAFELFATIMRKAGAGTASADAHTAVAGATNSTGQPLPSPLQDQLEQQLGGHDLSAVRIHTGPSSATAATAIAAKAYTQGHDIHFAAGQYDPASKAGQHLLAHEVAHTVQQQGVAQPIHQRAANGGQRVARVAVSTPGDSHEQQADAFADAFIAGSGPVAVTPSSAPTGQLARKKDDDDDFETDPEEQPDPNGPSFIRPHGQISSTPLPVAEKKQLTDKDVYGGVDKEQAARKKRLARLRASYRRITRKPLKKRYMNARYSYQQNVRMAPAPSYEELFQYGVSRGFFHPWDARAVAALFKVKIRKQDEDNKRREYWARVKRRDAFISQAEGVKFNVTSQAFQQILIAPVITAVDMVQLIKAASDPKNATQVIAALLLARTRTRLSVTKFAAAGAKRELAQAQQKLQRLDEVIARSKKAADAARIEHRAAMAELGRVVSNKPLTILGGGPFSDPQFYAAAYRFAVASIRKGKASTAVFIARLNKVLAMRGSTRLTAEGKADATKVLEQARLETNNKQLTSGNPTTHTLGQVRNKRGRARWEGAEQHGRQLYGDTGSRSRHHPVPAGNSITGKGGRNVDVLTETTSGQLAIEIKMYQRWRHVKTSKGKRAQRTDGVPLSKHIQQQVLKDVYLRQHQPGFDPRWVFLDAPPSKELADFLAKHKIVTVVHH